MRLCGWGLLGVNDTLLSSPHMTLPPPLILTSWVGWLLSTPSWLSPPPTTTNWVGVVDHSALQLFFPQLKVIYRTTMYYSQFRTAYSDMESSSLQPNLIALISNLIQMLDKIWWTPEVWIRELYELSMDIPGSHVVYIIVGVGEGSLPRSYITKILYW